MVSFLQVSLLKFSMNFWSVPRSYMPSLCGPLWLNHPNNIWWRVQIMKLIIIQFSASSCDFLPLRCKWTCHTSIVSTTELRDMILNVPASYSVGFRFESELGNGVSGLNVCSFSFGATGWMIGGSSPVRGWEFSLHHRVQTGFGAHPASYLVGTRGCFLWGKAAGVWSWPLTSI